MKSSFPQPPWYAVRFLWLGRLWIALRAHWRMLRIHRFVTQLLGPEYRRSRDMIEIDITYACNLACFNCNRSVRQAPENLHISLAQVEAFVDDSIARDKRWRRIRVLGGEPTFHPKFTEIISELRRYQSWHTDCIVEVVTNGHGERVERKLATLSMGIWVDNSRKVGDLQPAFGPFNLAPVDDPKYRNTDYSNGCIIMQSCGMGLTPMGYYPCAVAGGIDRIIEAGLGQSKLPNDNDDMGELARQLCSLCGRFRDGFHVPKPLRPPLLDEKISPTWQRLYEGWRIRKGRRAPQNNN